MNIFKTITVGAFLLASAPSCDFLDFFDFGEEKKPTAKEIEVIEQAKRAREPDFTVREIDMMAYHTKRRNIEDLKVNQQEIILILSQLEAVEKAMTGFSEREQVNFIKNKFRDKYLFKSTEVIDIKKNLNEVINPLSKGWEQDFPFMNIATSTYYALFMAITLNGKERLFPLVIDDREEALSILDKCLDNDLSVVESYTGDITGAVLHPFLLVEKTTISDDRIELDDMDSPSGELSSEMIPIDYVSEVMFSESVEDLELSELIEEIIYKATYGFESKQVAVPL